MIDPAEREHCIDTPYPSSHSNDLLDEVDKALDALVDALKRANCGEGRGIVSGLPLNHITSKIANVFASLPTSRLIALLERNSDGSTQSMGAVLPAIVASGAADRVAGAQLFRRLTTASRINALQRACDSVARRRLGAN